MSDAIRKLHDYLAKSPSVVYPEDVLEYLPAIEAENDRLREEIHWLKRGDVLHVLTDQELAEQQKREREMQASITALDEENAKLRVILDGCALLLTDRQFLHLPELREEIFEFMREFGIEVDE